MKNKTVVPPIVTTFDGLNMQHFAAICLFCDCFNILGDSYISGKLRQSMVNLSKLGGL